MSDEVLVHAITPWVEKARTMKLRERLVRAIECLDTIPHTTIEADRALLSVEAYALVKDINPYDFPKVEAWCVVKHYGGQITQDWSPRVWTAHATKKQAQQFARAILNFYKARHAKLPYPGKYLDDFRCERAEAAPSEFVHPDLTAAQYVRRIG